MDCNPEDYHPSSSPRHHYHQNSVLIQSTGSNTHNSIVHSMHWSPHQRYATKPDDLPPFGNSLRPWKMSILGWKVWNIDHQLWSTRSLDIGLLEPQLWWWSGERYSLCADTRRCMKPSRHICSSTKIHRILDWLWHNYGLHLDPAGSDPNDWCPHSKSHHWPRRKC